MKIRVRKNNCVGCRMCEMACSLMRKNSMNPFNSAIYVVRGILGESPVICRQCKNPKCLSVCPTGAIYKDPETDTIKILEEDCIGCLECVSGCPFGAMRIDFYNNMVFKCDLCSGAPECVSWCPNGALDVIEDRVKEK